MTAACTTYLMVLQIILSEEIVAEANEPRRYRRQKSDGDTVVEKIYAQWHQCG